MLARSHDDGSNIGRDMSGAPLIRDMHERPAASVYYFRSPIDGVQRLSFYKKSDRYPVLVLATRAKDEVLEGWRAEALARMAFVLGLILLIAIIGFQLVRQLHQGERLGAALRANEADFRLLAEQCSDVVTRIGLDDRILLRLTVLRPEFSAGTPSSSWERPLSHGVNARRICLGFEQKPSRP